MRRSSIILVVVALGLLSFIVFFERGSLSTTEREVRKGRILKNFVRDRVTRLELQRHGVTTVLVRVPRNPDDPLDVGGWEVQAPYHARADSIEVDSLLGALEWAEPRRTLGPASPHDLKQFGLDAPRYRVRFVAGREQGGFSVGVRAPDGSGAYLKPRDSDAVYVVGADLLDALEHDAADFHIKTLHEGLTIFTTQRLSLRSGGGQELTIVRSEGFFWIEDPLLALASRPEVKSLVDAIDSLRASRYVGEKVRPEYGLASPRFALTLGSLVYDPDHKGERKTERFSLQVGDVCGQHSEESYIQVGQQGSIYCAPTAELAKFHKTAEQLRDKRVLPLEDDDIIAVVLRDKARELSLETKDDVTRYRLTQKGREVQSGVADPDALKHWYAALRGLAIEAFQPIDAARQRTLERTGIQATFKRASRNDAAYVLYVNAAERSAVRLTEPALLQLPPRAVELLAPMGARYRPLRVLSEDESQLRAISVVRPGAETERVQKTGSGYEVVAPLRAKAAGAPLDELARLFSGLQALSFDADSAKPRFGLSSPFRTLRVEYAPDANSERKTRVHTLVIGNKSGDRGRYARLDDDPAVFVVSNALAAKLEEPLLSHTALGLPVDRLRELELRTSDHRVVVQASKGSYIIEGGDGEASAARARGIVEALAQLKAEHVRDYGQPVPSIKPRLTVKVELVEPAAELDYRFFEQPRDTAEKMVLVRRSDLPVTWILKQADLQRLLEAVSVGSAKPQH